MNNNIADIIMRAYQAFNDRNIEQVLELMDPDVNWPNGWEGGCMRGREAVRHYWQRLWSEVDPYAFPLSMHERGDGKVEVEVEQLVKDLHGNVLFDAHIFHLYTLVNGRIMNMEILMKGAPR